MQHAAFGARYACCAPETKGAPTKLIEALQKTGVLLDETCALGKTKVFLRQSARDALEDNRAAAVAHGGVDEAAAAELLRKIEADGRFQQETW